jgi:hypothetical protein
MKIAIQEMTEWFVAVCGRHKPSSRRILFGVRRAEFNFRLGPHKLAACVAAALRKRCADFLMPARATE